ncbi:hypothetical protein [Neolewinella sp.]|uniref:hypothetical protein n=1 Tax=Neolewinella sp. TaxID=2993543 RepID=UPI003B52B677
MSTGKMVVAPGGTLELRGTLIVRVAVPDRDTQSGNMFVDGTTSVGAALQLTLAPAYAPTGTLDFTLINSLPVTDTFATVDLPDTDASVTFRLRLVAGTVAPDWVTAEERNSDYFGRERQSAAGNWTEANRAAQEPARRFSVVR